MGYISLKERSCGSCCNEGECPRLVNTFCNSSDPKYYAHKDDISAMVEWAEERHRNKGGLVICSKASDSCMSTCRHIPPHKHNSFDTTQCNRACHNSEAARCIAYRGNPEANEEECEEPEVAKEYVATTKLTLAKIADSAINPEVFIKIFREASPLLEIPAKYTIDKTSILHKYNDELETLGFIEEKVHDPVIGMGDCFVDENGDVYQFSFCTTEKMHLVLIASENTDNNIGQGLWPEDTPVGFYNTVKLSDSIGKDRLSYFKPCKVEIKITEVKDGD